MLKGFRDFILRGNVVDLAVAIIVGQAFNQVVQSLVKDILTPLIGAIGGKPDFSAWKVGPLALGSFINSVVSFLVVSAAIYFLVVAPLEAAQKRLARKAEGAPPPEPPEEVKLLREILETLRSGPR